jgi:hypothetical protein
VCGAARIADDAGMSIDMFVDPDADPRTDPPAQAGERATLVGFLRWQRDTLELKCSGLDAADLARRSVDPSTLSLLGLVRHLADVERGWFRRVMAGQDVPPHFSSGSDPDGDFDGAAPDPALVAEAWEVWCAEVGFAGRFVAEAPDLDVTGNDPWRGPVSLRWVLAHMIEEYAPPQRPRRPAAPADRRQGRPVVVDLKRMLGAHATALAHSCLTAGFSASILGSPLL